MWNYVLISYIIHGIVFNLAVCKLGRRRKIQSPYYCVKTCTSYLTQGKDINLAAFKLAREVADEGNALVSISLSEPTSVLKGQPKEVVQPEMRRQLQLFIDENCDIDFVACEVP